MNHGLEARIGFAGSHGDAFELLEPQRWANSTVPSSSLYSAVWTAGALASTSRDVAKWGHTLFSGSFLQAASLERMLVFSDKQIGGITVPMGMGVWDLSVGDVVAWGHGGRLDPFLSRMFEVVLVCWTVWRPC